MKLLSTRILDLLQISRKPITVTARSKAQNVIARSNTGIVGSYPIRGMDVCSFSIVVLACVGRRLAAG
jgi:hypothetical protein